MIDSDIFIVGKQDKIQDTKTEQNTVYLYQLTYVNSVLFLIVNFI